MSLLILLIAAASLVAIFAADVDLLSTQSSGYRIFSEYAGDDLGRVVGSAGDVNGDGISDTLFVAPNSRKVFVIFGKSTQSNIQASSASSTGFTIFAGESANTAGLTATSAGDVNNDGFQDILVGLPNSATYPGGVAYVVLGGAGLLNSVINLQSPTSGYGFRITGAAPGDRCGHSVGAAGKVNGDQSGDIIVGCNNASPLGRTSSGVAYVIYGSARIADISVASMNSTVGFRIVGPKLGMRLGNSVSSAGDVNDDGLDDVAVTTNSLSPLVTDVAVAIIYGKALRAAEVDLAALGTSDGAVFYGGNGGYVVSKLGRFNYDVYSDILVGCSAASPSSDRAAAGMAVVLYGASPLVTQALTTAGLVLYGAQAGDNFGASVSSAGDVNGDGLNDLLIGAPKANVVNDGLVREQAGVVYLIFSTSNGYAIIDMQSFLLTAQSGLKIFDPVSFASLGTSVSALGDVNADGITDLVVSAAPTSGTSTAFVLYGGDQLMFGAPSVAPTFAPNMIPNANPAYQPVYLPNLASTSNPYGFSINGAKNSSYLGSALATGDVNADGRLDLIMSAPYGQSNAGVVYVLYGQTGANPFPQRSLSALTSTDGFTVTGSVGENAGVSVAFLGDVNKDGYGDLAVCSRYAARGVCYVVFGISTALRSAVSLSILPPSRGFKILSASTSTSFGRVVSAAGDMNGDGFADIVIGDPNASAAYVILGSASVSNIDMAFFVTGTTGFRIVSADPTVQLGANVSRAGDVNGDGFSDVIIGSSSSSSTIVSVRAYVVFGGSVLTDVLLGAANGVVPPFRGFKIFGSGFSVTVSGAGDFNGDGYQDVIVGVPDAMVPPYSQALGIVYVIYGHNASKAFPGVNLPTFTSTPTLGMKITGDSDMYRTGSSVCAAGDVNGDGVDDVFIGSSSYMYGYGRLMVVFGLSHAEGFGDLSFYDLTSNSRGFSIYSYSAADMIGDVMTRAGDLNRDGVDDIILGAPQSSPYSTGLAQSGAVYVLNGRVKAPTMVPTAAPTRLLFPALTVFNQYALPGTGPAFTGAVSSSYLGSVMSVGDVNKDGVRDLLMSSSQYQSYTGKVYVVYSSATMRMNVTNLDTMPSSKGYSVLGPSLNAQCGFSLNFLGDVNGDGVGDFIIGCYGSAYVVYGSATLRSSVLLSTLGSQGFSLRDASSPNFGQYTSRAGDLNGDGLQDFMVGDVYNSAGGRAVVFFGSRVRSDLVMSAFVSGVTGFRIIAPYGSYQLGQVLSPAGDLNGDGYADIFVGGLKYNSEGTFWLGVVIFGHSNRTAYTDQTITSNTSVANGFILRGTGYYLVASEAGDFNNDGFSDFVVGSAGTGVACVIFGHSATTTFPLVDVNTFGSDPQSGFRLTNRNERAGAAVARAGDVNSDGIDDIVIANQYGYSTIAYVLFGHSNALPFPNIDMVYSSSFLDLTRGFMITGPYSGGTPGIACGDLNNDGLGDIVVGSIYGGVSSRGVVNVVFGKTEAPSATPTSNPTFAPSTLRPTASPSTANPSANPTYMPTASPTFTAAPTAIPSNAPTLPPVTTVFGDIQLRDLQANATAAGFAVFGAASTSAVGKTIATADFNGDGTVDILIGSPNTGSAYVLLAPHPGHEWSNVDLARVTSAQCVVFTGYQSYDKVGFVVSATGDLDGDHNADIMITAPYAGSSAGRVYVLYSSALRTRVLGSPADPITPAEGFVIDGAVGTTGSVGINAIGVEDVNSDEMLDFVVAATTFRYQSRMNSGAVYLLLGSAGNPNVNLTTFVSGIDGIRIFGMVRTQLGTFLDTADIDADGRVEVLLGTSGLGVSTDVCVGYVLFTGPSIAAGADIDLLYGDSPSKGFRIFGKAGRSVLSNAGDVNGDGFADIVLGSSSMISLDGRAVGGVAYVIFGHDASTQFSDVYLTTFATGPTFGFRIIGSSATERIGFYAGKAGDFNNDGYDDLVVSSATLNGRAYVLFGHDRSQSFPDIDLGDFYHQARGVRILEGTVGDNGGTFVNSVGDINGDGIDDIVVGAVGVDTNGRSNNGAAYFLYGSREQPTAVPSAAPSTSRPSSEPTMLPTYAPTLEPSLSPSVSPTLNPSAIPTMNPSLSPTLTPTPGPTISPSAAPTANPTATPSANPSANPTRDPTTQPTATPTLEPSAVPSAGPTLTPSSGPTASPTLKPTAVPTAGPSVGPTAVPSAGPTLDPSAAPTTDPTVDPSGAPSAYPSAGPTVDPSAAPTAQPTVVPTVDPTADPSVSPTAGPTAEPTVTPTEKPTAEPSAAPSEVPNAAPTVNPSVGPTTEPTVSPSVIPSASPALAPTAEPTVAPSDAPTEVPSANPSELPIASPTEVPTAEPTASPSAAPSHAPSADPTVDPSAWPTAPPSVELTVDPTASPTADPSTDPTDAPIVNPTAASSAVPSEYPSAVPTESPSADSSAVPSRPPLRAENPSAAPTPASAGTPLSNGPTVAPAAPLPGGPTIKPSVQPSAKPTEPVTSALPTTAAPTTVSTPPPSALFTAAPSAGPSPVFVSAAATSVKTGSSTAGFITLSVGSRPTESVTLFVALYKRSGNAVAAAGLLVPDTFTLSALPLGGATVFSSALPALPVGEYFYNVTVSGPSAQQYVVRYASSSTAVTVVSVDSPLPAPALVSAEFADDGADVVILFNAKTNRGGVSTQFACSLLFVFACAEKSTCVWSSASNQVSAYVSTAAGCASVGSLVSLASTAVIKAECSGCDSTSWPSTPTGSTGSTVTIQSPTAAVSPAVTISAPNSIGECDSLALDTSSSAGNGGRAWASRSVQVTSAAVTEAAAIQQLLTGTSGSSSSAVVVIPSSYFAKNYQYNFMVSLCNFLGQCSQASKTVSVMSTTIPTVTLPGASTRTVKRSASVAISSDAFYVPCQGVATRSGLTYAWAVSVAGVVDLTVTSASRDPSKLLIPANTLRVGSTYDVVLTVTIVSTQQSASASMQVLVASGAIVPVIAQGLSRSVRVGGNVVLDASSSFDEDQVGLTGGAAGLQYSWTCVQTSPVLASTCADVLAVSSGNGSSFSASALSSAAGAVVQVTLTLLDAAQARSAQSVVTIAVLPALSPLVTISSNLASSSVLNSNRELQLVAAVSFPRGYNGSVAWSVDDSSAFSLAASAKSPLVSLIGTSGVTQSIYLVIAANSLPDRSTLTFALTARLFSSEGTASVTSVPVTVNAPPMLGTFTVAPRNGTEIVDPFTFVAAQWVDSDLPLQYQFAYVSPSGAEVTLRSKMETAYTTLVLTAGLKSDQYAVGCVLGVFDALSAVTSAIDKVTVLPQTTPRSTAELASLVRSSLKSGADSVDGRKQSAALGSYLLNQVDCSAAPNCSALNRHGCFRTQNTCGMCISNAYLGTSGDSNELCVLSSSIAASNVGGVCSSNVQCSAFETCGSDGICARSLMQCKNNCSSPQGSCKYVDINSGAPVSACYVGDTDCAAQCECSTEFIGSETCSLNSTQLLERQDMRLQLLRSVEELVALEEADLDTVEGWINTLLQVAQVPDELSGEAAQVLLSIADSIIAAAEEVGVSIDTVASLMGAVDAVVQAGLGRAVRRRRVLLEEGSPEEVRRLLSVALDQNSSLARSEATVASFRAYLENSLVPGQDAVELVLPQLRVFSQVVAVSDESSTSSISVSVPLTALEIANGQAASVISVPTSAGQSSLRVSLSSVRSEPYNTNLGLTEYGQLFSNPLTVDLSGSTCAGGECWFEMTLQTGTGLSSGADWKPVAETYNTTCSAGDPVATEVACSDGTIVPVTCDGKTAYTVESRCPVTTYSPVCNALAGTGVTASGCRVVSRTETSLTCSCPLGAGRRLQGAGTAEDDDAEKSVSVSYVGMLSQVKSNFVNTIISAQGLNASSLEKGWSAMATVGSLALAILFAFYWSHHADADAEKIVPKSEKMKQLAIANVSTQAKVDPQARRSRLTQMKRSGNKGGNRDVQIAEQALPTILSSQSLSNRVTAEVKQHHKWFGIVFHFSRSFPRVLRVASLATNVIIMLFIQSLTYALTNGDDGTCKTYQQQATCIEPSSAYATGSSKCYWSETTGKCAFVEPDSDIKVILFVAIFSALVCTPFALLVDYIIFYVLSAPTKASSTSYAARNANRNRLPTVSEDFIETTSPADAAANRARTVSGDVYEMTNTLMMGSSRRRTRTESHDVLDYNRRRLRTVSTGSELFEIVPGQVNTQSQQSTLSLQDHHDSNTGQRDSMFGSFVVLRDRGNSTIDAGVQLSAQSDLRNLVEDISNYRLTLSDAERAEFDLLWGLDENGFFKTDEELHSGFLQRVKKTVSFGSQSNAAASGSVSQRVLLDLRAVHETLNREEALAAERKFDNRQKGRRLLFLFQRDLLPGVSGMILESKGQRDNISAPQVSREAKFAAWTFLTVANVGMLFYILLFALSQTTHRQGAWAMSFALWLVVEILLVSSATVVFTHILVPSLIMQDVKKIKMKLVESIRAFNHNVKNRTIFDDEADVGENGGTNGANFNAANYLFTSTRLAKKWHELREAQIIAQFRTPWPKQSYMRESSVSKSYSKKYTALTRSASIVAVFFFTQLLQIPPGLQDMVVQMVATASIGYTVLLHMDLFNIFPLLVVVPLLLIIVMVHFILKSSKASVLQDLNKMAPPAPLKAANSSKLQAVAPAGEPLLLEDGAVLANKTIWQHVSGSFDAAEGVNAVSAVKFQDSFDSDDSDGALNMPRTPPLPPGGHLAVAQRKGHANRKESVRMGVQVLRALQAQHESEELEECKQQSRASSEESGSEESESESGDDYGVQVRVPVPKRRVESLGNVGPSSSSGEYVDISELPDDTPRVEISGDYFTDDSEEEEEDEETDGLEEECEGEGGDDSESDGSSEGEEESESDRAPLVGARAEEGAEDGSDSGTEESQQQERASVSSEIVSMPAAHRPPSPNKDTVLAVAVSSSARASERSKSSGDDEQSGSQSASGAKMSVDSDINQEIYDTTSKNINKNSPSQRDFDVNSSDELDNSSTSGWLSHESDEDFPDTSNHQTKEVMNKQPEDHKGSEYSYSSE